MGSDRLTREEIHMATAMLWADRSKCKRMSVGCVITDESMRQVLSVGYNGPAKGLSNDRCTGEKGKCGCLHAEDNAVAFVDSTVKNKVAFVTHQPCGQCGQRLIQANVTRVVYLHPYRDEQGLQALREAGIVVEQINLLFPDLLMSLYAQEHP